jgi:predicted aminopeptidase
MDQSVQVWLEASHEGQQWRVQPAARASAARSLRYVLEAEKAGTSGKSRSSQSGAVQLLADKRQPLSTLLMNLQRDDRLYLNLKVFEGERLIAEKILDLPEVSEP